MRYRIKHLSHLELTGNINYKLYLKGLPLKCSNTLIKSMHENRDQASIIDNASYNENNIKLALDAVMEHRENYIIEKPINVKKWEPDSYKIEATTIWSFPDRGSWATHNGNYRGNWSPYIPRNVITRYSKPGDLVLDQFVGSGTTLVETKLLNRNGIGVDINPKAIELAKQNTGFKKDDCTDVKLHIGDARCLDCISKESVDLICTHPPYSNIIKYSEDILGDLSHCDIDSFLLEMKKVADESLRILKRGKYCSIMMGDTRKNKNIIPLGFETMQVFIQSGFKLKEIIIKEQHNCKATGFWYKKSIKYNFLLIAHEYLFIFFKP